MRKIVLTDNYQNQLSNIVDFMLNWGSIERVYKFIDEIYQKLETSLIFPYANRKSLYFDDDNIRDFIYKEYVITYKIFSDEIRILGIYKENLPSYDLRDFD